MTWRRKRSVSARVSFVSLLVSLGGSSVAQHAVCICNFSTCTSVRIVISFYLEVRLLEHR